jgi:hypothetical protein
MKKLKILILATAKTGNVWLRSLLAHLYGLRVIEGDAAESAFSAEIFDSFGDGWISHKHYPFSEEILAYAKQNNIILITAFRHPGDILVSYFNFVQWITHSQDAEIALLRQDGDSIGQHTKYFVESGMFVHHLAITHHWKAHCLACVFYEDLLENPVKVLAGLAALIQPASEEQIVRAVAACQMKYLRVDREGQHFRKGKNLQWKELPQDIIEIFKSEKSYPTMCRKMGYSFEENPQPPLRPNVTPEKFQYSKIDPFYQQDHFDNGVKITVEIIRCYFSVPNALSRWPKPTDTKSSGNFFTWLASIAPEGGETGEPRLITPYARYLYDSREDVQAAFPDVLHTDHLAFAQWFVTYAPKEYEIDEVFIQAVANAINQQGTGESDDRA